MSHYANKPVLFAKNPAACQQMSGLTLRIFYFFTPHASL
jgi:hypothetical protein